MVSLFEKEVIYMIWLYFLIPCGLLVLLGVGYDFFKRKSFKEVVNNGEVNQNVERAKRDVQTWDNGNYNGF